MLDTAADRLPTWCFLCPLGIGLGHKEFDGYIVGQRHQGPVAATGVGRG